MNRASQLIAKKELLTEMEILRLYSTPGLFLIVDKKCRDGTHRINLTKEQKRLLKTRKGRQLLWKLIL